MLTRPSLYAGAGSRGMTRLAARFAVGSRKPVELLIPLSTGSGKSRMPLGALLRIAASRAWPGPLAESGPTR